MPSREGDWLRQARRDLEQARIPDWRGVFLALEAWAEALAEADPTVLGVLLYGSLNLAEPIPCSRPARAVRAPA